MEKIVIVSVCVVLGIMIFAMIAGTDDDSLRTVSSNAMKSQIEYLSE